MEQDKKITRLSERERIQLHRLYFSKPSLRQARQILLSRMLSNPLIIVVPQHESEYEVSDGFKEILDRFYKPLATAFLDDFFVFGYSHFYLQEVRYNGKIVHVPRQLEFGQYSVQVVSKPFEETVIQIIPNTAQHSMSFWASSSSTSTSSKAKRARLNEASSTSTSSSTTSDLPTIYPVIFEQSILPDLTSGKHRSIVSTLLAQFTLQDIRQRFTLQAEYQNAFPKLITTTRENKKLSTTAETFDDTSLLDSELLVLKEKRDNQLKLNAVRSQIHCQQELQRRVLDLSDDTYLELADLTENTLHLPNDVELAGTGVPNAVATKDLLSSFYHLDKLTLSAFGIPAVFSITQDVPLKNGNRANAVDEKMFFSAISGYKTIVEKALQQAFDTVYPYNTTLRQTKRSELLSKTKDADENDVNNNNENDVKKDNDDVKDETLGSSSSSTFEKQLIQLQITDDRIDVEVAALLYETSAITQAERRRYIRKSVGLPDQPVA